MPLPGYDCNCDTYRTSSLHHTHPFKTGVVCTSTTTWYSSSRIRPRLHVTGSLWSRYQFQQFQDACGFSTSNDITEYNKN